MLKHIKTLLRHSTLYISVAITVSITTLSLVKTQEKLLTNISNEDKFLHLFAYLTLTTSWLISKEVKFKKIADIVILICCFIFGIIIEVLQVSITTYRSASFLDVIANSLGIILGFILFKTFIRKKVDI